VNQGGTRRTIILAALLVAGIGAWIYAGIPWGVFTANFVTLLGMTQGILAIVIFLWLLGVKWVSSYFVPAGVITLSYAPIAILAIFGLLKAQGEIFPWARGQDHSAWFTGPSFIVRHLSALILFYAVVFYTLSAYLKDQAKRPRLLCFLLVLFVLNQTFVAWDFGMNLSPHWHSTIFAPYFWFGDLYAGLAILMLMVATTKSKIMKMPTWNNMRILLFAFSMIWAYLWWSQFIVIWYANIPEEVEPLYSTFSGDYIFPFVLMFLFLFLIPFTTILLDRSKKMSLKPILWIILLGNWIDRYLMVLVPVRRLNEGTGLAQHFTVIDGITTLAFFTGFLLLLSMFQGRFLYSHPVLANDAS